MSISTSSTSLASEESFNKHPPLIEIKSDRWIRGLKFSADGEYLISGGNNEVQVWRVEDGERMARMESRRVLCLAVSKDGKYIAAGTTHGGRVYVWDAKTFERIFVLEEDRDDINGVDFSPDSNRLVTGSDNYTASVWDLATRRQVLGPLRHRHYVIAVKYSPKGDRIATATHNNESVRVYDSKNGQLLIESSIHAVPLYNNSLVWSKDQFLTIISSGMVKRVEPTTGLIVAEWPVSHTNHSSSIALPYHGEFFAYSSAWTVTLLDTSMPQQLGVIQHRRGFRSMDISPDDRLLALIGEDDKITINTLTSIIVIPFMKISDTVLDLWKADRLTDAEELLTEAIKNSDHPSHQEFANRALIRTHLRRWEVATDDADKSIEIRPSVIGYIAKSITLIGKGNLKEVCRVYDLVFKYNTQPKEVDHLLLFKAIILFMAGEFEDAISRVSNLIISMNSNLICYMVQAHMYFLCGNSEMETNNYEGAIKSYDQARTQMRHCKTPSLHTITFISGWRFDGLGIMIHQRLCEALHTAGHTEEAGESLVEMVKSIDKESSMDGSVTKWISDFANRYISISETQFVLDIKRLCSEKLVQCGDAAADAQKHDDAIAHYSAALSLKPAIPQDILIKRSKELAASGSWKDALNDANEVIELNPSSIQGYERKYVALSEAGNQKDALDAYETMLSKMAQSPDPEIRERRQQYTKTQQTIRTTVHSTIRESPSVLINTTSGRLCDKSEQAIVFELSSTFAELTLSTTIQMDHARIKREVTEYFRYATFSHKLEASEPSLEDVINTTVYELEKSPAHDKLQKFCEIVRDAGYRWAWSSTCCIDRANHVMLQETLVSMFRWYQESSMTVVLLFGVSSPSQRGDLANSIWATRAWLFQEYHASKVVRFYNEDWTLYRKINTPNHKDSPEIIEEIEEVTRMPAKALTALRPGLGDIRRKLRLASMQQTTLLEDAAYSLFGIFSVSLPVDYGEGDKAIGHLLSHLLTNSRDTSIISWTGKSGSFNSCLPSNLAVFHEPSTTDAQSTAEEPGPEVDEMITNLRASSLSIAFLMKLLDRLNALSAPWFAGQEMKLPCITFKLEPLSSDRERTFRMQTALLGVVKIETDEDLSQFDILYLVHPWIDFLLDRAPVGDANGRTDGASSDDEKSVHDVLSFPGFSTTPLSTLQKRASRFVAGLKQISGRHGRRRRETSSLELPSSASKADKQMRAVQFAVRLKKSFDALLLVPDARNRAAYRRVAAESQIAVQIEDITPATLKQLLDGVRVLDVV